jgi:GNAT superfamily N-acetyltransferase
MIQEILASDATGLDAIRALFSDYADAIGRGHLCHQNFDQEMAKLPGAYAPPSGGLWLARVEDHPAGCVALRSLSEDTGELKRLFLRSQFRGHRLGRTLAETAIGKAREIGYRRIRLDTMPTMTEAATLYRSMGFREIEPYCYNPVPGALHMELDLQ